MSRPKDRMMLPGHRLKRKGRSWHVLIGKCGIVGGAQGPGVADDDPARDGRKRGAEMLHGFQGDHRFLLRVDAKGPELLQGRASGAQSTRSGCRHPPPAARMSDQSCAPVHQGWARRRPCARRPTTCTVPVTSSGPPPNCGCGLAADGKRDVAPSGMSWRACAASASIIGPKQASVTPADSKAARSAVLSP
jgi:hypothetical protein